MSLKKNSYYSSKKIRKYGALYNVVIGQRSNGKTYDWKANLLDRRSKDNDYTGAYIRRLDVEIAPKNLSTLFDSHDIEKIFHGKFNAVEYRTRAFTLVYKEDGVIVSKDEKPFCYAFALNTWEAQKGADRGEIKTICFDEFMTRKVYLTDEFVIFQNIISSIIRDRDGSEIFMLANTVNKYCPYFKEMGLTRIDQMKQGDIDIYEYGDSGLKVAVEFCAESGNTKDVKKYFAFDNPQLQMITTGTWEIALYPKCPIDVNRDEIFKQFYIFFNGQKICGDIVKTKDRLFILYHMHTGQYEPNEKDVVYLEQHDGCMLHCKYLTEKPTELHTLITKLIAYEREFYAGNEVGEIIRNWKLNCAMNKHL